MLSGLPLSVGIIHVTQQTRAPQQEHGASRWRLQPLDPCADLKGIVRMVETIETVHSATITKIAMKSHRSLGLSRGEGQLGLRWRKDDLPKRCYALFHGEFSVQRERGRPWNRCDFDGRGPFSQRRVVGLELYGSHAGTLTGERKACDPRINGHEHLLGSRSAWRTFW